MRLAVICVLVAMVASASALDVATTNGVQRKAKHMSKQRLMQLQSKLDQLKALDFPRFQSAAHLGWWEDNKCSFCKNIVAKISNAVLDKIINAPADASADLICLIVDGIVLPACIAIAPGGSLLCPPAVAYMHTKCSDTIHEIWADIAKDAIKAAKRKAKQLVAADFPALSPATLCSKLGAC